jgi:signal transduction histidine kinase
MLNCGLKPAILSWLITYLNERMISEFVINLDTNGIRYDPHIEQYIFRIVQQACENAIRHSNASLISISGNLDSNIIHLRVEDDGLGFRTTGSHDLEGLLKQKHYGLVGMYERALVINADLMIHSEPGSGTCVEIFWSDTNDNPKNLLQHNI